MFITGSDLTIEDVYNIAVNNQQVSLSESAKAAIISAHQTVTKETDKVFYGINTGFGSLADTVIDRKDASQLSRNIIISHAVGVGEPLPVHWVRAAMVVRANALSKGHSGVSLDTVQRILDMLNFQITPIVPSKGSLACSGDLCLLAHMALVFTCGNDSEDGKCTTKDGVIRTGKEAFFIYNLERVVLGPKEGLAITNGSSFTAGVSCLLYHEAQKLYTLGLGALSMSCEALLAVPDAFDYRIHAARNHKGQLEVANSVLKLRKNSTLKGTEVQDCYSLRCAPQVQGVLFESLEDAKTKITNEINAATDNPLVFDNSILSGGNFHGEILAYTIDTLKIALAETGAISERRVFRMIDKHLSKGLPPMMVQNSGLNSGYMMPSYTMAALCLDNQKLASCDSIFSLPTCANTEDHNSNGWNAARNSMAIIENLKHLIATEFQYATRGITFRKGELGEGTKFIFEFTRSLLDTSENDFLISRESNEFFINLDNIYNIVNSFLKRNLSIQNVSVPPGTRDFSPKEMLMRENIMNKIKNIFKLHGAGEIDTPTFERKDILMGKYGEQQKLVFDLTDGYTLRYDLTVPLARYVAQHNISSLKRYHIGKVFRKDCPSIAQGRMREFYQMDFDIVGKTNLMQADAEIFKIVSSVLDTLEIPNLTKVNHKQLLNIIFDFCKIPDEKFNSVCSTIDKLDKLSWVEVQSELISKGISFETTLELEKFMSLKGSPREILSGLKSMLPSSPVFEELSILFDYLEIYECKTKLDLSLCRGLDYYTGVILETIIPDTNIGSIVGGGRYDKLIGMFCDHDVPSVGMSFGLERIFTYLKNKEEKISPCDYYIINLNQTKAAMMLANKFWSEFKRTEISQRDISLKEHLGYASESNIPYVIIIGENEVKNGGYILKNMGTKEQEFIKN